MADVLTYATDLTSMTGGKAFLSLSMITMKVPEPLKRKITDKANRVDDDK
jgi:hypothetical protein